MDFVCIRAIYLKISKVKRCNTHLFALEKVIEKIGAWVLKIKSMTQRMRLSAISLVSNEIKEAYVWLLDQFLEVMKGKTLVS